jgi:hypothetical protein
MLREILPDLVALVLAFILCAKERAPRPSTASRWNRRKTARTASRRCPPSVALQPEGASAVALLPAREETPDEQP